MYETVHVVLVEHDEIIASTEDGHAPLVQLYNPNMIGGPITLQFGNASNPEEGLRILERFFEEVHKVRRELLRRAVNTDLDSRDPRYVPHREEIVVSALEQRAMDGDR